MKDEQFVPDGKDNKTVRVSAAKMEPLRLPFLLCGASRSVVTCRVHTGFACFFNLDAASLANKLARGNRRMTRYDSLLLCEVHSASWKRR